MGGKKKTKWRKLPPEELSHITIKRRDEQRFNFNNYDDTAFKHFKRAKDYNGSEASQGVIKTDEESSQNIYFNETLANDRINEEAGFYANGIWVPVSHMHDTATLHHNHSDIFHTVPVILHQSSSISPSLYPPFHSYHTLDGSFPTSYFVPNNSHYFYYLTKFPTKENEQVEEQYNVCQNPTDNNIHEYLSTNYNIYEDHSENLKSISTNFDSDKPVVTENEEIYENTKNPNYVTDWMVEPLNATYEYPGYGFGQQLYNVPLYVLFPPADSQAPSTSSWPMVQFQKRRKRRKKSYAEYAVIPKKCINSHDSENEIEKHTENTKNNIKESVLNAKETIIPNISIHLEGSGLNEENCPTQSDTDKNILTNVLQEGSNHEAVYDEILLYVNNLVENILKQAIKEVIKKLEHNKSCNENLNNTALVNNTNETNNDKEIINEIVQYLLSEICQDQDSYTLTSETISYDENGCLKGNQSNVSNNEIVTDFGDDHNNLKNIEFVTEDGEKFLASLAILRDLKLNTFAETKTAFLNYKENKDNMAESNQVAYEQMACSDLPHVHKSQLLNSSNKSHVLNKNLNSPENSLQCGRQNTLFKNDYDDHFNANETSSSVVSTLVNENALNLNNESQKKLNKLNTPSYINSPSNYNNMNQFSSNRTKLLLSGSGCSTPHEFTSHEEINDNFIKNNSPSQYSFTSHSVSSDVLIRETEFELNKLRQLTSNSNQSIYKLAYDDQPESEDNNTTHTTSKNELACPQSCKNIQPEFSHSEIIIHEVDSASDAGSEDVELLPHRYESDTSKGCNKHIYVNNLSLAVELLRTRESLPYDHEFKRIVDDDTENEIQEENIENIKTTSGASNPGFIGDSTFNSKSQSQRVDHLELKKVNSIVQNEPEYKKVFRNSIIDSGVQSEDSEEDIGEEGKDMSGKQNESSNQCNTNTNLRRLGTQARQRFNIYSPRASIMNPCFCCCIM